MITRTVRAVRSAVFVAAASSVLVAAPPAAAADPAAAAFKKATKSTMKEFAAAVADAVKEASAGLKTAAASYANATVPVGTAMHNAVVAVSSMRDAIEDGAAATASLIGSDGAARLAGGASPGADFLAGGRGVWDDALAEIDKLLDKSDAQLDAAFLKFALSMKKAAVKKGAAIDLRYRLPPHGEGFWLTEPPTTARSGAKVLEVEPPQITIAVRMVETSHLDHLDLGLRGPAGVFDIIASSSQSESIPLGSPFLAEGSGTASFGLSGLSNDSLLNVEVVTDLLAGLRTSTTLSQPSIVAPSGIPPTLLKDFTKLANQELKAFNSEAGRSVADYIRKLASHIAAVKRRQATPDLAIATGFGNLRDARAAILGSYAATSTAPVTEAAIALKAAGVVADSGIPSDLAPDGVGIFGGITRKWAAKLAGHQSTVTAKFDSFIGTVDGLAQKQSVVLDVNAVLGRDGAHGVPTITLSLTPTVTPLDFPRYTDVLLVRSGTGSGALRGDFLVQSDPMQSSATQISYANSVDGTVVIGGLASDSGGVSKHSIPGLSDIPLLGYLFRAGRTMQDERTLLVILTPQVSPGD